MAPQPFEVRPEGIVLRVYLTPRARGDAVKGLFTDSQGRVHLKVRVRAVPEDGKANEALIALLAKHFDIPPSAITLITGHQSRQKKLLLSGLGPAILEKL